MSNAENNVENTNKSQRGGTPLIGQPLVIGGGGFEVYPNAGAHNSLYRGKFLGNQVTDKQYAAIAAGTFDDLFIGDYWTIDGRDYLIAHFDYCMNFKSVVVPAVTSHHVVMVPRNVLYLQKMHDPEASDADTVGYANTDMYKTGLEQAKTIIKSAFNGHVLTHATYLVTIINEDGSSNSHNYFKSEVDLMNEIMVIGCNVFSSNEMQLYERTQLSLFRLSPKDTLSNTYYWLRDRASNATFCMMNPYALTESGLFGNGKGVRPYFIIG